MEQPPPPSPPSGPPNPPAGAPSHCPQCGYRLIPGQALCPHCGMWLAPGSAPLSVAGMVVVGILALFLGGMGTCSLVGGVSMLLSPSGAREYLVPIFLMCALYGAATSGLSILCVRRILDSIRARRNKL